MELTPAQLHILQHSLGCDCYGRGRQYRNNFVTSPQSKDGQACEKLVSAGLMTAYPYPLAGPDSNFYHVTSEGKKAMREQSPAPPKLSRGQKRYREWLDADSSMKFGDWLKRRYA